MIMLIVICLIIGIVYSIVYSMKEKAAKEEAERKAAEKERQSKVEQRQQQNQRGKDHSWLFPAEEFYNMCAKENATDLSNEYGFVKATNYAKQLIARENPLADMSSFNDYIA